MTAHATPRKIEVYTTTFCPYCVRAKALLDRKHVAYTEIDCSDDDERRMWLMEHSGRKTVPQIFIDDVAVGGSDDLHALDRRGELDKILSRELEPTSVL